MDSPGRHRDAAGIVQCQVRVERRLGLLPKGLAERFTVCRASLRGDPEPLVALAAANEGPVDADVAGEDERLSRT